MKKTLKSTFVMVAIVASCLGTWKTYTTLKGANNSLLMENILALSQGQENTVPDIKQVWVVDKSGLCYVSKWTGKSRTNSITGRTEWYYEAEAVGLKYTWRTCVQVPSTKDENCTKMDCSIGSPYNADMEGWKPILNY